MNDILKNKVSHGNKLFLLKIFETI